MAKIRVSIVEDIQDIRQGFTFLVNSSDELTCIQSYSCGEDLLTDLEKNKPDVIIMDIGLPGMSGIDCTREVKSRYPSLLVMICSVYDDDERLFNALAAGASGYILKRSSPGVILDAVKDLYHGGSPMSSQIARRVVDSLNGSKRNDSSKDFNLTEREMEILELVSAGHRNKEIAQKLYLSAHTVRSHIYNIYEKLHVRTRVEALNKIFPGRT